MTEAGGAPRARALVGPFRQAREAANVGVREVARRLGISHCVVSYCVVSYWETSKRVPRLEDVASYLTEIGVTGDERETILALFSRAFQTIFAHWLEMLREWPLGSALHRATVKLPGGKTGSSVRGPQR